MNEVLGKRLLGACALVAVTLILANLLPDPQALPPSDQAAKRRSYDLRPAPPAPERIEREAPPVVVASLPADTDPVPPPAEPTPVRPKPAPPSKRPSTPPKPVTAATVEPSVPKPAVAEGAGAAPSPASWYVQIGAFAREANAQNSVRRLQQAGLQVRQDTIDGKLGRRYRVRCGPFTSREDAENERLRATKLGFGDARLAQEPSG